MKLLFALFSYWPNKAGRTLAGLTRRRQAEYQQCLGKDAP